MFGRKPLKIFCIGRNKTGTTSLRDALQALGFGIGHQPTGELLMEDWAARNFAPLIRYCRSADAFKDVPFSLDYTYQALDAAYPGARFVLTVRDSARQWYGSLTTAHTRLIGKERLPTADDLREHVYHGRPGWMWRQHQLVYGADESTLYDEALYTAHYERHNERVLDYFGHRPDDLLVLNVAHAGAMEALCAFVRVPFTGQQMPHVNRSGA